MYLSVRNLPGGRGLVMGNCAQKLQHVLYKDILKEDTVRT